MLVLIFVALLLRILAAVAVEVHVQAAGRSFLIEGDANGYWELGRKLAAGQDYTIYDPPRRVLRVPGFPLLLAACIRVCGDRVLAARIVLAGLGTICCCLVYALGVRLHSRRVGFLAGLFVAVNPLHVGNSVLILSETYFTFWMLLSLLALVLLLDARGPDHDHHPATRPSLCGWRLSVRSVLTGGLIGAAVLVRPGFLPWLVIAGAGIGLCLKKSLVTRGLVICGLVAGCCAVLSPWAARNASVTDHWVWTSLWSGPSLYDGLNPDATGASNMQFFDDENVMLNSGMTEFEMNAHYAQRAVQFAKEHPARVAQLALRKAGRFLSPVPNSATMPIWVFSAACVAFWLLLWAGTVAGINSRQWNRPGLLAMAGPLVLFLMVHMVFVGSVRYRLPVEFPLSVLAAIGWYELREKFNRPTIG